MIHYEEYDLHQLRQVAKMVARFNPVNGSVDQCIKKIKELAEHYGNMIPATTYVATCGYMITFYEDQMGCRRAKFSIEPGVLFLNTELDPEKWEGESIMLTRNSWAEALAARLDAHVYDHDGNIPDTWETLESIEEDRRNQQYPRHFLFIERFVSECSSRGETVTIDFVKLDEEHAKEDMFIRDCIHCVDTRDAPAVRCMSDANLYQASYALFSYNGDYVWWDAGEQEAATRPSYWDEEWWRS